MLLITSIHAIGYGVVFKSDMTTDLMLNIIGSVNSVAVNGFILLSAFFIRKGSNPVKIIKLETQLLIYGLVLLIVSIALKTFSLSVALKSLFPILSYHWWYPVNYIILLILSPYLIDFLATLNRKKHFVFITILIVIVQGYLQCNPLIGAEVFIGHSSHGLLWWIELFVIGDYLRKYGAHIKILPAMISFLISIFLIFAYSVFLPSISLLKYMHDVFQWNGFFSLVATVSLFIIFSRLNISIKAENKKLLWLNNKIVPAIFGVYLIQEHNGIREWLWNTVSIYKYNAFVIPLMIILVFLGLLLCSVVINELNLIVAKAISKSLEKLYYKGEYD